MSAIISKEKQPAAKDRRAPLPSGWGFWQAGLLPFQFAGLGIE